jgi:hypothetical protein
MTFKSWWKKLKLWKKISLISLVIILYSGVIFGLIILFYPVAGRITENSWFLTISCQVKPLHYIGDSGIFICSNEQHYTFRYLREWKGYRGCNESTKGYNGEGGISNISRCYVSILT